MRCIVGLGAIPAMLSVSCPGLRRLTAANVSPMHMHLCGVATQYMKSCETEVVVLWLSGLIGRDIPSSVLFVECDDA